MQSESAEVTIVRDAENDIKMRGLEVYVDGTYADDLKFNSSYSFSLPAGDHTVMVSNHLYKKSLQISLKPGEKLALLAGNSFTLIGGLMVSVLGMGPYKVFLRQDTRAQTS